MTKTLLVVLIVIYTTTLSANVYNEMAYAKGMADANRWLVDDIELRHNAEDQCTWLLSLDGIKKKVSYELRDSWKKGCIDRVNQQLSYLKQQQQKRTRAW